MQSNHHGDEGYFFAIVSAENGSIMVNEKSTSTMFRPFSVLSTVAVNSDVSSVHCWLRNATVRCICARFWHDDVTLSVALCYVH